MKLYLFFLAVLAWGQDNEAIDDKWNAKWQKLQRENRALVRKWSLDCRSRIPGGTLQGQQNGLIACVVQPPPQATKPSEVTPPKPKEETKSGESK